MEKVIKSTKGLVKVFRGSTAQVQDYFQHLPKLLDQFPLDVSLSYSFARLELGQNMALYCGVVKIHKANAELARAAVGTHHMSREGFVGLYKTVFDLDLPKAAAQALKVAEDTRDAIMHGKPASDKRLRNAIARVLEYAEAMNSQLETAFNLKPFGSLKGFAGRSKKLDKKTTRYMLKGMGFDLA